MSPRPLRQRTHLRPLLLEALEARIAPATFTWIGGNGNWNDPTHWNDPSHGPTGFPSTSSDIALFDGLSPTVTLNGEFTIQQLQFVNGANATLNNGTQLSSLDLINPAGKGVVSATGSSPVINVGLTDGSAAGLTFDVGSIATISLAGSLSSATAAHGQVFKTGAGILTLSGNGSTALIADSGTIGFRVEGGTLKLQRSSSNGGLNVSSVVLSGASLQVAAANQISDNVSVTLLAGSNMALSADDKISQLFGSGELILNDHQLTLGADSTFNGDFLGNGKLLIAGTTFTLAGNQGSNVSTVDALGGTLRVTGNYGSLTVHSGIGSGSTGAQFNETTGNGRLGGFGPANSTQGNLSPGSATGNGSTTGILTVAGAIQAGSGSIQLTFNLNDTAPGTGFDQLVIADSGSINPTNVGVVFSNYTLLPLAAGQSITIIDVQNNTTVTPFTGLPQNFVIGTNNGGSNDLVLKYNGGTGNDVTITAVANSHNTAPTAVNDLATINEDTPTQIAVLRNDTDPNPLDQLTVTAVGTAAHGMTVIQNDTILYTPARDYFGSDTFTYTISDGRGGTSMANVNLTINDVPDNASYPPTSIAANGKTATFLQADGDTLVVKTTKGKFTAANFNFVGSIATTGKGVLALLDLSAAHFGTTFKGAAISTSVTKGAAGDGFADIGYIDARGIDLKSVSVKGDLGQIDAGDAKFKTAGLGSLTAYSLGHAALANQFQGGSNSALLTSTIIGKLGALKVVSATSKSAAGDAFAGQVQNTFLHVVGDGTAPNYKYGSIGSISLDRLIGGQADDSEGDVTAGLSFASGAILAEGKIGKLTVNAGLDGGAGSFSGSVLSRVSIGAVTVGKAENTGNLAGAVGAASGSIFAGSPDISVSPTIGGKIGPVTLKGSLTGSDGNLSGTLFADGGFSTVKIGGGTAAGTGSASGAILSNKGIQSIHVTGDVSGNIYAFDGNVGSISIGGTMSLGIFTERKGIFVDGTLGSLTVGKLDATPGDRGFIQARGLLDRSGHDKPGNAIGKITVKGDATGWDISAGTNQTGADNPYASIGTVAVTGNATNFNVLAATQYGNNGVAGGGDDIHTTGTALAKVFATIASITVKGTVTTSVFEAQLLKKISLHGTPVVLMPGALDDDQTIDGNTVKEL